MYNLLVSNDRQSWNGDPFYIEHNRCISLDEYTNENVVKMYGDFSNSQIDCIKKLPCIFAYEYVQKLNPKFGFINAITKRQGQVKIEYEIITLNEYLNFDDFQSMQFELDIGKFEMNRTHWAIKDVDLEKELKSKSIDLPTMKIKEIVDIRSHIFDIALSFPGEIRSYIEEIITELDRNVKPNTYFYDYKYQSQLAVPKLDVLLQDIYRNRSNLVVVFLCEKYQEKKWCGIEFSAIREIIYEKQDNKIMFIRVDDGKVDGVFNTDGYIDARQYNASKVVEFICQRVVLLTNDSKKASNITVEEINTNKENDKGINHRLNLITPSTNETLPIWNDEWLKKHSEIAMPSLLKTGKSAYMEVRFALEPPKPNFTPQELNEAARISTLSTSWPIGVYLGNRVEYKPKPKTDGIVAEINISGVSYDYWAIRRNGDFYLLRSIYEDQRDSAKIFFDIRIIRITEVLLYCARLFNNLKIDSTKNVSIVIKHGGIKGRIIGVANASKDTFYDNRICEENDFESKIITPLSGLESNLVANVKELTQPLFELFYFFEISDNIYDELVNGFVEGKIVYG